AVIPVLTRRWSRTVGVHTRTTTPSPAPSFPYKTPEQTKITSHNSVLVPLPSDHRATPAPMAPTAAGARLPLSLTVFMAVATTMLLAPAEAGLYGDRDALMALRRGLQDPDGALRSWSPELGNMNPCINWSHVTCDRVANRVTEM
uniref:Leucine-rich repeat-containing N-terminal plant-type domain-containing protein n=1 Tax=Aegilops tauschii subsp. strangulata TaxID=200361 RepID=A0A452ZEF9_AEGTS